MGATTAILKDNQFFVAGLIDPDNYFLSISPYKEYPMQSVISILNRDNLELQEIKVFN
jgi:hypothetical protein